jgi:hypothetical protein
LENAPYPELAATTHFLRWEGLRARKNFRGKAASQAWLGPVRADILRHPFERCDWGLEIGEEPGYL